MAESATTSQTEPSPLTGPSSFGSALDAQGLPTVHEVSHHKVSYDFNNPADHRSVNRPSGSRHASLNSSVGRGYNEKGIEAEQQRAPFTTLGATASAPTANHVRHPSHAPSGKLRKGDRRNTILSGSYSEPTLARKPKRGGLRNTIRRMFSKSPKDKIRFPGRTIYPQYEPEEFITSATEVKGERSASVPGNAFLRSSGLSSHPPFQPPSAPCIPQTPPALPASERPSRPRRASVPNATLAKDDMQAVTDAMSGLGLQTSRGPNVEAQNIGFAVTNGSNPKRRSRSVGAFREVDHRMSPIQWRHHRTRSDEIRCLRESAETAPLESKAAESPGFERGNIGDDGDGGTELEAHNTDFNFGLSANEMHGQERIGLEERLITLEIKLMDFEYALSKLQAGSLSPSRRASQQYDEMKAQESGFSNNSPEAPSLPNDGSPRLPQRSSRSSSHNYSTASVALRPKDRPTSIATTLKPSHNHHNNSFSKIPAELAPRSSLSGLTVEHYTTLVTLIRHEQSARVRLEEQVSHLQGQIERLQPSHNSYLPYASSPQHSQTVSNHSHTFSNTSSSRRRGIIHPDNRRVGQVYGNRRPRSSSYSTSETDTDDENYHDAYVTPDITPMERGEYERGAFERIEGIEDGAAF